MRKEYEFHTAAEFIWTSRVRSSSRIIWAAFLLRFSTRWTSLQKCAVTPITSVKLYVKCSEAVTCSDFIKSLKIKRAITCTARIMQNLLQWSDYTPFIGSVRWHTCRSVHRSISRFAKRHFQGVFRIRLKINFCTYPNQRRHLFRIIDIVGITYGWFLYTAFRNRIWSRYFLCKA